MTRFSVALGTLLAVLSFGAGTVRADVDADGIPDPVDNCPLEPNNGQSDVGGLGGGGPDGVGDVCQCGDAVDDGSVLPADVHAIREALVGTGSQFLAPQKCSVWGAVDSMDLDANGVRDDCNVVDVVVIRRALSTETPGVAPVCEPASGGPTLPGDLTIVEPLPGPLAQTPVRIVVAYQGSVQFDTARMTLLEGPVPTDVAPQFLLEGGRLAASLSLTTPGLYDFIVEADDAFGTPIVRQVSFDLLPFFDLSVVGASLSTDPDLPESGVPFVASYQVENTGTLATPGVTSQVTFTPALPPPPAAGPLGPGGLDPAPDAVPPLAPGEVAGFSPLFPAGLSEPGDIGVAVDTFEQINELNEINNAGLRTYFPAPFVYTDLDVGLESFELIGLSQIALALRIRNAGNQVIQVPRLRYSVRSLIEDPNDPGNPASATFGNYQVTPGGDPGPCLDTSPTASLLFVNQPLGVGEELLVTDTAFWNAHGTPAGDLDGATGFYRLCIEGIAKVSGGPAAWLPQLNEIDSQGQLAFGNNVVEIDFDVRDVPPYPADGALVLAGLTLNGTLAGTASSFNLILKNEDAPAKFGEADVEIRWRAVGGRDGADPNNPIEATTGPQRVTLLAPRTAIPGIAFPAAPGRSAVLPHSTHIAVDVTVTSADANDPVVLIDAHKVVKLVYKDLEVVAIASNPVRDYVHPVPSGGVPITLSGVVRNWSDEPHSVSVLVQQPAGNTLTLASASSTVEVPAGGEVGVHYFWSPSVAGNFHVQASIPPAGESAGLPSDNTLAEPNFPVYAINNVYALDILPDFDPNTYNFDPNSTDPNWPVIDYGDSVDLAVVLYANGAATASLVVEDQLGGATIHSSGVTFTAQGYGVKVFNWTPSRAGFHHLRVKIDGGLELVRRIDVAPQITEITTAFDALAITRIGTTDYNVGSQFLRLHAKAEPGVFFSDDAAEIAGARLVGFNVDGGNDNGGYHLVRIVVEVTYSGVVQIGGASIGSSSYLVGVGAGIKPRAGTAGESISHFDCYDLEDASCVTWHRGLWSKEEGDDFDLGFVSGDTLELANSTLQELASALWGSRVATPMGAILAAEEILVENATCDEEVNRRRKIAFIVPLRSGDYDAYLLLAGRVETETFAGYSWSYIDFYDRYSTDCGGARDGLKIEFIGGGLYSPVDGYFDF